MTFLRSLVFLCFLSIHLAGQSTDPYLLKYTSYLGGSDFEQARDLTTDQYGNVYITGGTSSSNFPTTAGAYNVIYNNASGPTVGNWGPMMVFISKFSPQGNLIWSTYLGGPNYDRAYAIEVDSAGYVYVGGRAGKDFPTTVGAFQTTFTQSTSITPNALYGHQNGFIAKLSPDGSQLIWSTYYGADSYGFFRDIDIDQDGYIYGILNAVSTKPGGIPDDAFDSSPNGNFDMVAVKFNPDGSAVEWATFLGGSGDDQGGPSIRVGADKSVYVAGSTKSSNFPTTPNAVQPQFNGQEDMFVTRIAPDGKSLIYSTYFGGSAGESSETHSLFVDHLGQAYVACGTGSSGLPTTPGALKMQKTGTDNDGLFFKLSADGMQLLACTYFGGSSGDFPEGLYVDSLQNLYVGGGSSSTTLPVTLNAFQAQKKAGTDGFVVKLNPDFSKPLYCSYFGGTKDESVRAFHVSDDGAIYVSGQTLSLDLPVTSGAFQSMHASPNNNNKADSYLAIFGLNTVSVDELELNSGVKLFPNPVSREIYITSANEEIQEIQIVNSLGDFQINTQNLNEKSISFPVENWPTGIYWVVVTLRNHNIPVKLLLSKP